MCAVDGVGEGLGVCIGCIYIERGETESDGKRKREDA